MHRINICKGGSSPKQQPAARDLETYCISSRARSPRAPIHHFQFNQSSSQRMCCHWHSRRQCVSPVRAACLCSLRHQVLQRLLRRFASRMWKRAKAAAFGGWLEFVEARMYQRNLTARLLFRWSHKQQRVGMVTWIHATLMMLVIWRGSL